jgi:hypothetical protein
MQAMADSGIAATGKNPYDTCNGTFKHCFNPGARHVDEETTINIQKIVPDGIIDARSMGTLCPYHCPPNRLVGLETLVEMKTVASLNESNEAREQRFLNEHRSASARTPRSVLAVSSQQSAVADSRK